MTIIRIDAAADGALTVSGHPGWRQRLDRALDRLAPGAPVVLLVHGYRYAPGMDGAAGACPHRLLYREATAPLAASRPPPTAAWADALGFSGQGGGDGLCIPFGWQGRRAVWGSLARTGRNAFSLVYEGADAAGAALGQVLVQVRRRCPAGRVAVLAHSLGARVVFGPWRPSRRRFRAVSSCLPRQIMPARPAACFWRRTGRAGRCSCRSS